MKQAEKFIWLSVGAGGGAGLTYLFGTKDGKRVRRRMLRLTERGRSRVADAGGKLVDRGKQMVGDAREVLVRGTRAFPFPG